MYGTSKMLAPAMSKSKIKCEKTTDKFQKTAKKITLPETNSKPKSKLKAL
jgi:hypothetical protein